MPDFPHLNLKRKLRGTYQFTGIPIEKTVDPITQQHLDNRQTHGNQLSEGAANISAEYAAFLEERRLNGLPDAFTEEVIPVFLKVDPQDFDIEALKGFGIEIVSEEENGFIIGANADKFSSLTKKIQDFIDIKGRSKHQAAKLWEIIQGSQWRADYILSEELRERYPADITDQETLVVDISVACYVKMPDRPIRVLFESDEDYETAKARYQERNKDNPQKTEYRSKRVPDTDEQYQRKIERWQNNILSLEEQRDEMASARQAAVTDFIVGKYKGELLSSFVDMEDSFGFRAKLSGQALKDFIRGYPYVFEIAESEQIVSEIQVTELPEDQEIEVLPPPDNAPTFCVIDSGVREEHILLAPAVLSQYSKNYVPNENTTADEVANGGHGTKVAGAILYGNNIPEQGINQLPCFIVNARVLDAGCQLPEQLYPPELMEAILDDFDGIRLFNMSIASTSPCRVVHMSTWAAKLDSLIHQRKVLFILAIGNLMSSSGHPVKLGIREHLEAGRTYPQYLLQPSSRLANPAQSMLALTVGSVCSADFEDPDRISFGKRGYISSFSRCGPGLWQSIKPDVVEFGGDFLREVNGINVSPHDNVAVKVVKSGGNRTGFSVGTSFAAPKVAHIVARLASEFPEESVLFYKALVVQSARLPEHVFYQPNVNVLRAFGYGIPDLERALNNNPYRITFIAEGKVAPHQANVYSVKIPPTLSRAGTNYDILLEVTLAYTAEPRRTRRRLRSYLSSWLSWDSSKLGENFDVFTNRVLKDMEEPETIVDVEEEDVNNIKWTISTSPTYGLIKQFKRQDSPTQKDWAIIKSNKLGEELSFAVVGHKGWDKDTSSEIPFALSISFEIIARETEIYSLIEAANQVEIQAAALEAEEEVVAVKI